MLAWVGQGIYYWPYIENNIFFTLSLRGKQVLLGTFAHGQALVLSSNNQYLTLYSFDNYMFCVIVSDDHYAISRNVCKRLNDATPIKKCRNYLKHIVLKRPFLSFFVIHFNFKSFSLLVDIKKAFTKLALKYHPDQHTKVTSMWFTSLNSPVCLKSWYTF